MPGYRVSQLPTAAGLGTFYVVEGGVSKKITLGSMASQDASNVAITGGLLTGLTRIEIRANAPLLTFVEADNADKTYGFVLDGGTFRLWQDTSSSANNLINFSSGNCGIGLPGGASEKLHVNGNVRADAYFVGANQVVGARGAAVADAAGGATIDAQARTAINTLLARLRTHGLIAP